MKHRNELMKREIGYKNTIKDLKKEIETMSEKMKELKESMRVIMEKPSFDDDSTKHESMRRGESSHAIHHLY
jgi:hypothetical protein